VITVDRLKELLSYDPETGIFTWRIRRGKCAAGSKAGSFAVALERNTVMLDGRNYCCGRLAWLYTHGVWPTSEVNRRDRNPANDRLSNLREATRTLTNANQRKNPRCKYRGAYPHRESWQAKIKADYKTTYLGKFPSAEAAARAYDIAAAHAFGEFAQLNFPSGAQS
jgi:hypothetical protein